MKTHTEKKQLDSDDTLSNTSIISSIATKTVQFSRSPKTGNKLTAESCILGMRDQISRYIITFPDAMEWVKEYHSDKQVPMGTKDMDGIHKNVGLK